MSANESSSRGWRSEKKRLLDALSFVRRNASGAERASGTSWEKGARDFLGTFGFVKADMPDWRTAPPEEAAPLAQELGWRAIVQGRLDAIASSSVNSWFRVRLNGVSLLLPRYTLMIMRDCLTASANPEMSLLVETAHWEWMKSKFGDNTVFLDIGAAAGTMTVPYALSFPEGLRIVSSEPSRRACDYLDKTLTRNGARNVTVLPFALSDAAGHLSFMELPEDPSGLTPYLPEGSRLQLSTEELYPAPSDMRWRYGRSTRFRSNCSSARQRQLLRKLTLKALRTRS